MMMSSIKSITGSIVLCSLLLSGCSKLATRGGQAALGNTWRFDAYRITEGKGQVFADTNNSYSILPNGAKAARVEAPDSDHAPKWSQQGAVIRIAGCLDKVLIVAEGGDRLAAAATTPCSSSSTPDPKPINKAPATQVRPLADEPRPKASPIKPLKQKGKTP